MSSGNVRTHGSRTEYSRGCRCLPCTDASMAYRRRGLPPGDPRHGTPNAYTNWGCRCRMCCAAHSRDVADRKAKRIRRGLPPGDPRHGSSNGYGNYGCRCDACRAAHTRDSKVTRRRRVQKRTNGVQ